MLSYTIYFTIFGLIRQNFTKKVLIGTTGTKRLLAYQFYSCEMRTSLKGSGHDGKTFNIVRNINLC